MRLYQDSQHIEWLVASRTLGDKDTEMAFPNECAKFRALLIALYRDAYCRDFTAELSKRDQELWLLGLDSKTAKYIDLCGKIDSADLAVIQAKGFINADAGYLADAQSKVQVHGKRFDLFMVNVDHFIKPSDFIEPIIVHELAHLLELTGEPPAPVANDDANADAILRVLDPGLLAWHPKVWALHLAIGGRVMVQKRLTGHKTIRAYLEAAVPHYDRYDEPILAI
jgi:hypothetical protein